MKCSGHVYIFWKIPNTFLKQESWIFKLSNILSLSTFACEKIWLAVSPAVRWPPQTVICSAMKPCKRYFCALLSNDLVVATYAISYWPVEIRQGKHGGKVNHHWGTEVADSPIFLQKHLFTTSTSTTSRAIVKLFPLA